MSRTKEQRVVAKKLLNRPAGKFKQIDFSVAENVPDGMTRVFKNNHYVVMIFDDKKMTVPFLENEFSAVQAMVQRHDDKPIPNHWSELQKIKNEIFGTEAVAIEYYPEAKNLIDMANIYWLWLIPTDYLPRPAINKKRQNHDDKNPPSPL